VLSGQFSLRTRAIVATFLTPRTFPNVHFARQEQTSGLREFEIGFEVGFSRAKIFSSESCLLTSFRKQLDVQEEVARAGRRSQGEAAS
jgi:hypothetical protein